MKNDNNDDKQTDLYKCPAHWGNEIYKVSWGGYRSYYFIDHAEAEKFATYWNTKLI